MVQTRHHDGHYYHIPKMLDYNEIEKTDVTSPTDIVNSCEQCEQLGVNSLNPYPEPSVHSVNSLEQNFFSEEKNIINHKAGVENSPQLCTPQSQYDFELFTENSTNSSQPCTTLILSLADYEVEILNTFDDDLKLLAETKMIETQLQK